MKFGVREICDVVFKAKSAGQLGNYKYNAGQPVLYIDSAKTSTIEGAASTVYAQGGRGNSRLIAWEGEKTLTFTVEDALLSPVGFAILSGAGLLEATSTKPINVHYTSMATLSYSGSTWTIDLTEAMPYQNDVIDTNSPVFVMEADKDGSLTGKMFAGFTASGKTLTTSALTIKNNADATGETAVSTTNTVYSVFVDYYIARTQKAQELTIEADNFAGYYYVEASTLFKRQYDGVDLPAEIIFPNVKIQSNFTFSMASSGDPSTFTFTMDAMPGYTYQEMNKTSGEKKKVLCAIQIIDEDAAATSWTGADSIKD